MSIDPKFVELTADVLEIFFINSKKPNSRITWLLSLCAPFKALHWLPVSRNPTQWSWTFTASVHVFQSLHSVCGAASKSHGWNASGTPHGNPVRQGGAVRPRRHASLPGQGESCHPALGGLLQQIVRSFWAPSREQLNASIRSFPQPDRHFRCASLKKKKKDTRKIIALTHIFHNWGTREKNVNPNFMQRLATVRYNAKQGWVRVPFSARSIERRQGGLVSFLDTCGSGWLGRYRHRHHGDRVKHGGDWALSPARAVKGRYRHRP